MATLSDSAAQRFYTPYTSDSESDSGSESDTTATSSVYSDSSVPDVANFALLAQGLSLPSLAGPTFDASGELLYERLKIGFPIIPEKVTGSLKSSMQTITSIIMLDSRNRDRVVFPQPTNLTLRLPREYRNVTNFQIVQIKFLSSFFYFRNSKANTSIPIIEQGRTTTDQFGNIIPLLIDTYIREGTYDINALLNELTIQLNYTPLFYDFPNGFSDFAPRFAATGDFSLGFNFPGDYYYDSLLDQFVANPTATTIVTHYFQSQYANQSSYTGDQIKVAYYYPVLKEILLDTTYSGTPLNETLTTSLPFLLPGETERTRIIYTFQGINGPVIQELIANNVTTLDAYRVAHTFRGTLVNKYILTYETNANRVIIYTPSLNTSLVNLLNYKYAQFFAEQLAAYGLTEEAYNNLRAQNAALLAVLNDMYYYIQRYLAAYMGVDFNTYTIEYLTNPNLYIATRDSTENTSLSSNFNAQVTSRTTLPASNDILAPLKQPPSYYWNRMTSLPSTTIAYNFNLSNANPSLDSNYAFQVTTGQRDYVHPFVDSNDIMYANQLTKYADILVPIEASKYTVFRFRSPVRQTLQVETLPRPTQYRYPLYNAANYSASTIQYFDNSYSFIFTTSNIDVSPTFYNTNVTTIPGFGPTDSNFGISYASSIGLWGSSSAQIRIGDTRKFYTLTAPQPSSATVGAPIRYPLSFTITHDPPTETVVAPMKVFLYHDRAAFMADISSNRLENPYHSISCFTTTTDISSQTITFPVYAGSQYYMLARSISTSIGIETYRITPWFPNGNGFSTLTSSLVGFNPLADPMTQLDNFNAAQVADPAFIRLPITSSLQTTPSSTSNYQPISFSATPIGYDVSGVSTDFTDYCGYIQDSVTCNVYPNSPVRIDPITGYIVQADTGYNQATQSYFPAGTGNAILKPEGTGLYSQKAVSEREYVIAHWYNNTYIPNSCNQPTINPAYLSRHTSSFTRTTTAGSTGIPGYSYVGSNQRIDLGNGVVGISFIPQQGLWDIQRFMFRSAFITGNPATDPNLSIKYIGVFPASVVNTSFTTDLQISSAIAVLKYSSSVAYSTSQNFGFDAGGGTYYEYQRDVTFGSGSNTYLDGYSQIRQKMNPDLNAVYTAVPFDATGVPLTYQALTGSVVPYPNYSVGLPSTAYLDGSINPTGRGVIVPSTSATADSNRGPPTGYDQTQSKYEQSMPIGTTLLQINNPYNFYIDTTSLYPWPTLPDAPSGLVADVPNFLLTGETNFRVYSYPFNTTTRTTTESYNFTLDQIFPSADTNVNYIGMAANNSEYGFFAFSNAPAAPSTPPTYSNATLLLKTMNPSTGQIQQSLTYPFRLPLDKYQVMNITYNNSRGFTMSLKLTDTLTGYQSLITYGQATSSTTDIAACVLFNSNVPTNIDYYITRQAPGESNGRYYVFPVRSNLGGPITTGITDYYFINPNQPVTTPNASFECAGYLYDANNMGLRRYIQTFAVNLITLGQPSIFYSPTVAREPFQENLYFLTEDDSSHFYTIAGFSASVSASYSSNVTMVSSTYEFTETPQTIVSAGGGGKWVLAGSQVLANRNDRVDAPTDSIQAWQIFYPTQRIVFKRVAKNNTRMQDFTGLTYPEYPHTAILGYTSLGRLTADTNFKWGLESPSNFIVADFNFRGLAFNGSVFSMPLPAQASGQYTYVAVRGYTPTEKGQVLMRFSLTNRYDFGYQTLSDISNEIVLGLTQSNQFNPDYYNVLQGFNSNFIFGSNGRTFGANVIPGFNGSNFSNVTGFGDFYSRFVQAYSTYVVQSKVVAAINAAVASNINNFISTELSNFLPSNALIRQRYTDPLLFSLQWESGLTPKYAALEEEWGLGWNLGYAKRDTPYETVQRAESFFKILDDFINLRMNPELDINRIDTGAKENLTATNDSTGFTKAFYGKLLLANFGSYAQTIVSNPVSFNPPLGRLDKLTFQWVDATGTIIDNSDCEWNCVVQIVETKEVVEYVKEPLVDPTGAPVPPPAAA